MLEKKTIGMCVHTSNIRNVFGHLAYQSTIQPLPKVKCFGYAIFSEQIIEQAKMGPRKEAVDVVNGHKESNKYGLLLKEKISFSEQTMIQNIE